MDFTLVILLGLATGSFGFALGLGIKNFTIPRIKASILNLINSYVAGFLQNLQEHPEQVDAIVTPFIDSVMRQLQGNEKGPGKDRTFKIAGIPIPQSLVTKGLEMLLGNLKPKQNSNSLLELPS